MRASRPEFHIQQLLSVLSIETNRCRNDLEKDIILPHRNYCSKFAMMVELEKFKAPA